MADAPRDLSKIPGFDERPSIDPASSEELDKLLKAQETPDGDSPEPKVEPEPKPEPEPKAEPEPKDEPKDEPKAEPEPKPAPDDKPTLPKADDPPAPGLDDIQLPPYSKPKSVEAFDKVKSLAKERIATVEKERDELKKQNAELAAKSADGLPKETEAELKELREFRAKMDVEADPQFKTFEEQVSQNTESIYARLKAGGFTDEHIEQIKKLGGPSEVDWESVAAKMPATLRRFVESKLVENEGLLDKKTRAINDAKKNATDYLREKSNSQETSKNAATKHVETSIKELIPKLGWVEERKPKDGASDADKKSVEAHNSLVKEVNTFLAEAISDDSPQLRGILAVGYAQLLKLRVDYAAEKATSGAKIKELETKLKDATELLDRVKKNSTTRFRDTPADSTEAPKKADDFTTPGAEALDSHLKAHLAGAK